MSNKAVSKTFIPQADGRGLDFIKVAAAVFMVTDHVNAILLNGGRLEMFMLGRITFPLFCYALAVALFKVRDGKGTEYALRRYAPRLLLFAVLAEPIARISRDIGDIYNVLFTLALGAAVAGLSLRMKDWHIALMCAAAAGLMYFPPLFEFSAAGVMLPAAFLLALRGSRWAFVCLPLMLGICNFSNLPQFFADITLPAALIVCAISLFCIIPPILLIRYAAASMPQTGRYLPKYFLHIFYPAHLLAIWAVGRYILHLPI